MPAMTLHFIILSFFYNTTTSKYWAACYEPLRWEKFCVYEFINWSCTTHKCVYQMHEMQFRVCVDIKLIVLSVRVVVTWKYFALYQYYCTNRMVIVVMYEKICQIVWKYVFFCQNEKHPLWIRVCKPNNLKGFYEVLKKCK